MTTIIEDVKLDFQDVLLIPKRSTLSSRSEVDITRSFKFKHSKELYTGTPIIAANMDHVGTIEMALAFKKFDMAVALHKFYDTKTLIEYYLSPDNNPHTFYSMGITDNDLDKFFIVSDALKAHSRRLKYICIDVANGYSQKFVPFVERMRQEANDAVILAGNVVTPDIVYDLLARGADIVKVGLGSSAVCLTRKMTGVGYPQLSAVLECQDAAHGTNGLICSDGGVVVASDLCKAYAAGADFVMCGSLFAGYSEGAYQERNDGKVRFYGMSSKDAMDKHHGGKANYRASEGRVVEIPYKGPIDSTIEEIRGGLRSCCTYVGARKLKDLPKCATFIKANRILNNSLSQYDI